VTAAAYRARDLAKAFGMPEAEAASLIQRSLPLVTALAALGPARVRWTGGHPLRWSVNGKPASDTDVLDLWRATPAGGRR
jgi:hypothetical protein